MLRRHVFVPVGQRLILLAQLVCRADFLPSLADVALALVAARDVAPVTLFGIFSAVLPLKS